MNLLFINSASKVFHGEDGALYLNPHITNNGFRQYRSLCDHFTMLIRDCGTLRHEDLDKFEKFDSSIGRLIPYPNIYSIKGYFDIVKQMRLRQLIKHEVMKADRVICGSQAGEVIDLTVKYCKKYNKPYMIYCLGMVFEGQWFHSLKGKLVAYPREYSCKRLFKDAPYAIYVTKDACQKRYPCFGKTLGCSDVEIQKPNEMVLQNRLEKFQNIKRTIVFGTAAYLDVKWKGHHLMLNAIAMLKSKGINVQYQMVGLGTGAKIMSLAEKLGISDNIKILGGKKHNEMFDWYDQIDVYVQPSYQEGLCRSIVEAMSRACPVICSNAGGNYELIDSKYIFPVGDAKTLAKKIEQILKENNFAQMAKRNFEKSKEYDGDKLNAERWAFIKKFIDNE